MLGVLVAIALTLGCISNESTTTTVAPYTTSIERKTVDSSVEVYVQGEFKARLSRSQLGELPQVTSDVGSGLGVLVSDVLNAAGIDKAERITVYGTKIPEEEVRTATLELNKLGDNKFAALIYTMMNDTMLVVLNTTNVDERIRVPHVYKIDVIE